MSKTDDLLKQSGLTGNKGSKKVHPVDVKAVSNKTPAKETQREENKPRRVDVKKERAEFFEMVMHKIAGHGIKVESVSEVNPELVIRYDGLLEYAKNTGMPNTDPFFWQKINNPVKLLNEDLERLFGLNMVREKKMRRVEGKANAPEASKNKKGMGI